MSLEIIRSDALFPMRHGFFTRKGGASSGVFQGLNCGLGSTDQSEAVQINRARVAEALHVPEQNLATLYQVHSPDVIEVHAPLSERPKADGMASAMPGLALGILTADCQPVLFADSKAKVIGAAHAGWKGALNGVLERTIEAMERLGALRENITAIIGPSISQKNYEVGPEFLDRFLDEDENHAEFFAQGQGDKYQFDLPRFGLSRLRAAGVGSANWTGHCTYEDEARFFSYRRSVHQKQADYGRLISAISL
ncbi:MAG: peptidoglycan editing factor PgeF [Pseudomonadota bacterium]